VVGIFCYYGFRALPAERILANRWLLVCAIVAAGLTMIAAAITTIGPRNAIIVGFSSTVLVFGAVLLDKAGLSVRWPILILLGDASYVIYLVHPYVEEALNKIVGRALPVLSTKTLIGMPVGLGLTLVASIVIYRLVDNPLHTFFRNLLCKPSKLPQVSSAGQRRKQGTELVNSATAPVGTAAD
jgi:peptidoglycan/LPS O-acetylase OafA/YrhL